jgi:hypothetical protein
MDVIINNRGIQGGGKNSSGKVNTRFQLPNNPFEVLTIAYCLLLIAYCNSSLPRDHPHPPAIPRIIETGFAKTVGETQEKETAQGKHPAVFYIIIIGSTLNTHIPVQEIRSAEF